MNAYEIRNQNEYAAEVIEVTNLVTLDGLDNLVGLSVNGYTALVPKSTQVGDRLVVFPAEAQLSEDFVRANNLSASPELNADPEAKGYLAKNRRVRAIRLRGHTSSALALQAGVVGNPEVGTRFDHIDGVEVSRKYELPVRQATAGKSMQEKAWKRVDTKYLPEHIDTENWFRNEFKVPEDAWITVTQKIHGTSVRISNTIVKRKPTWRDKVARWFGVPVAETEYAHVYGSRKVIKDSENPHQQHWYGEDLWSTEGAKYAPLLPEGVILYGELYGWVGDAPIQKGYTYDAPRGEARLVVYRVAVVTPDGGLYDLSREGVEEFCAARGLKVVPLLWQGFKRDFNAEDWLDKVYAPRYAGAVPLSDKGTVDEGVVVQVGGVTPKNYKAKSGLFLAHETAVLDSGTEVLS